MVNRCSKKESDPGTSIHNLLTIFYMTSLNLLFKLHKLWDAIKLLKFKVGIKQSLYLQLIARLRDERVSKKILFVVPTCKRPRGGP